MTSEAPIFSNNPAAIEKPDSKYIDHDALLPKFIPKPIESEIIQKDNKIHSKKKEELLTIDEEKERA